MPSKQNGGQAASPTAGFDAMAVSGRPEPALKPSPMLNALNT